MYAKFAQGLVKYLKARLPGTAIRPSATPPNDLPPYVSYERTDYQPVRQHDEQDGKRGHTGNYRVTVELVVWDTDTVRRDQVVDKIVGTTGDPGLVGWREWFPAADDPDRLAVQSCELADQPFDGMELPNDGSETRWYSTTITLGFYYAE